MASDSTVCTRIELEHLSRCQLRTISYRTSVLQAVVVREALVYILQHHVLSVSTCCAMLETACQASIKSLAASALRLVLSNFMQILQCHSSSFGLLSSDTLMMVLCCDSLQVACFVTAALLIYKVICCMLCMHVILCELA